MLKFPDDAAYAGGKKFFVEIYVTHAVDEEKLSKLKQTVIRGVILQCLIIANNGLPDTSSDNPFFLFACKSLIHFHQFGNAGTLSGTGGAAFYKTIGIHYSAVIGLVRLAQFRRHGQFIVKVCQAAVRVERTGIEDSLRSLLDF